MEKRLKDEVPLFEEYSSAYVANAMRFISKLYEFGIKENEEEIIEFGESIENLIETTKKSKISLIGMYEEIQKIVGLTTDFAKSKSKVIRMLDRYFDKYDQFTNDLEKLSSNIQNIRSELD